MKLINTQFPQTVFLLPRASTVDRQLLNELVSSFSGRLSIVDDRTYAVMARSDFIFVASGTATLEATCLTVPMVVVYRVSALSYLIARSLVKVEHIAMTNLVAGYRLVPELVQADFSPASVFEHARMFIQEPARTDRMRAELTKVRSKLQGEDAYGNAARQVLDLLWERER